MTLIVNGEAREFDDRLTVAELVDHLGFAGRPVAVEVNRALVRPSERPAVQLAEGDRIEIVTLVGGG